MRYILDQRTYRKKNGGYIGYMTEPTSTLNVAGITNSLIGNNSGLWDVNDHYQSIRLGNWPVEQSGLIQNYDAKNFYSYPKRYGTIWDLTDINSSKTGTLTGGYDGTIGTWTFSAVNQKITLADSFYSTLSDEFSLEFFFYLTSNLVTTKQTLFNFAGSTTSGGFRLYALNNILYFDGGDSTPSIATVIGLNTWFHVIAVRSTSGLVLYKNGSLTNSNNNPGPSLVVSSPMIGHNSINNLERWIGYVSEFRVYDRAVSADTAAHNFSVRRRVYGL